MQFISFDAMVDKSADLAIVLSFIISLSIHANDRILKGFYFPRMPAKGQMISRLNDFIRLQLHAALNLKKLYAIAEVWYT